MSYFAIIKTNKEPKGMYLTSRQFYILGRLLDSQLFETFLNPEFDPTIKDAWGFKDSDEQEWDDMFDVFDYYSYSQHADK